MLIHYLTIFNYVKMCSNVEHQAIDKVIDKGPLQAGVLDFKVVQGNTMQILQSVNRVFFFINPLIVKSSGI